MLHVMFVVLLAASWLQAQQDGPRPGAGSSSPGRSGDERDPAGVLRASGLARFQPGSPHLRIAEMLREVRDGKMAPRDFYRGLADLTVTENGKSKGASMLTVNAVKTAIQEAGGTSLLGDFFGDRYAEGGTPVEEALGAYRNDLVSRAIRAAASDPKIRALVRAAGGGDVYLAFVGTQPPARKFQLTNDVDFSFVGGNTTILVALRDFVNGFFVDETRLTMERIDALATAHGVGTPDVYMGEAGRKYGDSQIAKDKVGIVDFESGSVKENALDGSEAIRRSLLEKELRKWAGTGDDEELRRRVDEIVKPGMAEPLLSMEFARHLERDIIRNSSSMTAMECVAKGCKYLERSNSFFAKEFGRPSGDPAFAKFASDLTAVKKSGTPADMARVITEFFDRSGLSGSPFEVAFDPDDGRAVLQQERKNADAFLEMCRKQIWDNVQRGIELRTDSIRRRIAAAEGKSADDAAVKTLDAELGNLLTQVTDEIKVLGDDGVRVPSEVKQKFDTLIKLLEGSRGGGGALPADLARQLDLVKRLLEGKSGDTTLDMARAAVADLADKTMKANASLDWMDDTLLGPLRGDPEFEQVLSDAIEIKKIQTDPRTVSNPAARKRLEQFQGQLGTQCRKYTLGVEQSLNRALYQNVVSQGVKKMNVTVNEFIQSSRAGRAGMTGLTAFNLADEFSSYADAMAKGDFRELAAEIIRRRVPFGSAAEAAYQGRYLRACWDVFTTLFPPAGLPEAAYGIASWAAGSAAGAYWSAELTSFIDDLYASAVFEPAKAKTGDAGAKFELVSVTYKKTFKKAALIKGEEFILDPDVDDTLFSNLAQNDPFLDLLDQLLAHPASGPRVKEGFQQKKEARWKAVKQAYIKELVTRLEKRKNAEKAVALGELTRMSDELLGIAADLEVEDRIKAGMASETDASMKVFWTWLLTAKRGIYGEAPTESQATKAAAILMDYLETYRKVLAARQRLEGCVAGPFETAGLPVPPVAQHNQRLLTGIVFLTGKAREDAATATAFGAECERIRSEAEQELLGIKSAVIPGATLDKAYDRQTLAELFYEDFWISAIGKMKVPAVAAGSFMTARQEREARRNDIVKKFSAHYAAETGTVIVCVRQLQKGKKTDFPVTNAEVKLQGESSKDIELAAAADGDFAAKALKPGSYELEVSAYGFKTEQGNDTHTQRVRVSKPGARGAEPTVTVYLVPTGPDEELKVVEIAVTPKSRTIRDQGTDSVAILKAVVVPKPDSGVLRYQWTADDEVIAQGKETTQATLSGAGRAGREVVVRVLVIDEKEREGATETRIKVVSSRERSVKFEDHRGEIYKDQSETITVTEPVGAEGDFKYTWRIEDADGRVITEKEWSRKLVVDGRTNAGKALTITVTAADAEGGKARGTTGLVVLDEDAPAELEVALSPAEGVIDEDGFQDFTVRCTPFKDSGKISYSWDGGTTWEPRTAGRVEGKGNAGKTLPITVMARDRKGREGEATASLRILRRGGDIEVVVTGPTEVDEGVKVHLEASVRTRGKRGEAAAEGVDIEWVLKGKGKAPGNVFDLMKPAPGTYEFTVSAVKGKKIVASAQHTVTVRAPGAGIDVAVTGPSKAEVGGKVRFEATVTARDTIDQARLKGSAVIWYVDGKKVHRGTTLLFVPDAPGRRNVEARVIQGVGGKVVELAASRPLALDVAAKPLVTGPGTKPDKATGTSGEPVPPDQGGEGTGTAGKATEEEVIPPLPPCTGTPGGSPGGTYPAENYNGLSLSYSLSGATIMCTNENQEWTRTLTWSGYLNGGQLGISGTARRVSGFKPPELSGHLSVSVSVDGAEGKSFSKDLVADASESFNVSVPIPPKAKSGRISVVLVGYYANGEERNVKLQGSFQIGGKGAVPAQAPLTVQVSTDKSTLAPGETATLTAAASGGTSPITYAWTGAATGSAGTLAFKPDKAGTHKLTVTVTDAKGTTASASLAITAEALTATISCAPKTGTTVYMGQPVMCRVTLSSGGKAASGKYVYRFEPHPEVTFDPHEGEGSSTTAVFTKPGKTRVWVDVLQSAGPTLSTVAESNQVDIDVVGPKLTLKASPIDPYPGQEVKIEAAEEPRMGDDAIDFRWEAKGNTLEAGALADPRYYSFRPKDTTPVTVTVHGKAKDGGDDLGNQTITITARKHAVRVNGPTPRGPKPRVWSEQAKGLVEVENGIAVAQSVSMKAEVSPSPASPPLHYAWSVSPQSCTISNPISQEPQFTCSQTGTFSVTVAVKDDRTADLGTGSGTISVTVSQAELNKAAASQQQDQQKKETAKRLGAEAKALEDQEKFPEAIAKYKESLRYVADSKIEEKIRSLEERITRRKEEEQAKAADARKQELENKEAAARLTAEGKALETAGKLEDAVDKFKESLKHVPDQAISSRITMLEARVAKQKADVKTAEAVKKEKEKKDEARRLAAEGRTLESAGNLDAAADKFRDSLKLVPDPALQKRVAALEARITKQKEQARATEALKKEQAKATEALEKDQGKKDEAKRLIAEGKDFESAGKLSDAIGKFKDSLKLVPDPALQARVEALDARLAKQKADAKAAEALQKEQDKTADVQRKVTEKADAARRLAAEAKAFEAAGKLKDAVVKYKESLKQAPDPAVQESVRALEARIARDEQDARKLADARRLVDEAFALQEQGKIQDAIDKYEEAQRVYPSQNVVDHLKKLRALLEKGEKDAANRANASRLIDEGYELEKQGKFKEAVAKYEESLRNWPSQSVEDRVTKLKGKLSTAAKDAADKTAARANASRLIDEGYELEKQGKFKEAVAKYEESLRNWPSQSVEDRVTKLKGRIEDAEQKARNKATAERFVDEAYEFEKQGRYKEALGKYEEALRYYPAKSVEDRIKILKDRLASPQPTAAPPRPTAQPTARPTPPSAACSLSGNWITQMPNVGTVTWVLRHEGNRLTGSITAPGLGTDPIDSEIIVSGKTLRITQEEVHGTGTVSDDCNTIQLDMSDGVTREKFTLTRVRK